MFDKFEKKNQSEELNEELDSEQYFTDMMYESCKINGETVNEWVDEMIA